MSSPSDELIDSMMYDGLWDVFNNYHMGVTAENLAEKYDISREQQDQFAFGSQLKTKNALEENKFTEQIVPVKIPQRKGDSLEFITDEHPRPGITLEQISKLKPAFFQSNGIISISR